MGRRGDHQLAPGLVHGPDLSEALPSVPATTKLYTVSLGVASDEVLLQAIAAARGGLFQSIHSAAEVGKLHEIYVHLQALVGGEEVIAAGSDAVDGLDVGAIDGVAGAGTPDLPELAGLAGPASAAGQALLAGRSLQNTHRVPVDDTLGSVAFVVSWHDPGPMPEVSLVTPSLKVLTPGAAGAAVTTVGASYVVLRVDTPEPGEWQLRVGAGKARGTVGYTWGAHGDSPVGVVVEPPPAPVGQFTFTVGARLVDPGRHARSPRFTGRATVPTVSVDDIVNKNREALDRLKVRGFKPDTPDVDPALAKLPLLDLQRVAKGEPSVFESAAVKVAFTGRRTKEATVDAPVPGTTAVDVRVSGTTVGGFPFARRARCDVRT